jgi:hypothetical protein
VPKEHKAPTVATVKSLYYHATTCAEPSCTQPLYKTDATTGSRHLNSTVAHIAARCENGPRWDPEMSEEDNRSERNLLLLCHEHSRMIDENNGRDYPVEMLTEWKEQQLAEHGQGWDISDGEAQEVIANSLSITSTWSAETLKNAGRGGRGGDAFGSGSRAGDGGLGGDVAVGTFHLQPGTYPVKIGRGGKPGKPGGQTSIGDFKVGQATGADGLACTGMLANSAEIRDGLAFVLGGGWTFYRLRDLPGRVSGCLLYTIEVDDDRYQVDEASRFELVDPSGTAPYSRAVAIKLQSPEIGVHRHIGVVQFAVQTSVLGIWNAILRVDDDELLRVPFKVAHC